MSDPGVRRVAFAAIIELLIWLCLSGSFLFVYIHRFEGSTQAILPHLSLVLNVVLVCASLRLFVWRFFPRRPIASWAAAVVLGSFVFLLMAYYALVLLGLASWGRIISWRLVSTYFGQATDLIRTFGISPLLVWSTLAVTVVAIVLVARWLQGRFAWTRPLAEALSRPAAFSVVVLMLCIAGARLFEFVVWSPAASGEPVSLTLYPERGSNLLQSHSTAEARALDVAEDAARATYAPSLDPSKKNLIIIVGDALRPDHMSAYGYPRQTTPNIDRMLATQHGDRVDTIYSICGETSCGVLGLARSKYLYQLSPSSFSLYDALRLNGYRTHMILGGDHTNFYGLREAYGRVDSYFDGADAKSYYMNDDQLVVDHAATLPAWDGKPTFFQFHLMSSHALGRRHEQSMKFTPASNYGAWTRAEAPVHASAEEADATINFYDDGVWQLDGLVDQILGTLATKGYLKNALVIITADHGEMLGEHGRFGHANGVYQNVVRIPYLMLRYGYEPEQAVDTKRIASQIDIAPTIAYEIGIPAPSTWRGTPLQLPSTRTLLLFQEGSNAGLFDLRDPQRVLKYWRNARSGEESAYAVKEDPAEANNLIATIPAEQLDEWRLAVLPATNVTSDR